ncbi:MAG: glycosyltransferase family 2 protein [archaeon]
MKTYDLSAIVPTRNEEKIVRQNIKAIETYLKNCPIIRDYEILVCDYSTDKTPEIVKKLEILNPKIRYVRTGKKGIGAGIRVGIEHAALDYMMLYPIDLSWDLDCIENSLKALKTHDIVLASREHDDSTTTRTKKRIFFSKVYSFIINHAFRLKVADTQCTFAARRQDIIKYLDKMDSDSAFFQAQIIIHGKKNNLKIKEIPTNVEDTRKDSKINVLKDGTQMLKEIIREKLK